MGGGERRALGVGKVGGEDANVELEMRVHFGWFAAAFAAFVAEPDGGDTTSLTSPFVDDKTGVAGVVEVAYVARRTGRTVAIPGGW